VRLASKRTSVMRSTLMTTKLCAVMSSATILRASALSHSSGTLLACSGTPQLVFFCPLMPCALHDSSLHLDVCSEMLTLSRSFPEYLFFAQPIILAAVASPRQTCTINAPPQSSRQGMRMSWHIVLPSTLACSSVSSLAYRQRCAHHQNIDDASLL